MMVKVIGTKNRWDGKGTQWTPGESNQFVCELRVEVNGRPQTFVGKSDYTAAEAYTSAKIELAEFIVRNAQ